MSLITNEIIEFTIQCNYKGYLIKTGKNYSNTETDLLKKKLKKKYQRAFYKKNIINVSYIFNEFFERDKIKLHIDAFKKTKKDKLVPLLISSNEKITKQDKVYFSCILLLLKSSSITTSDYGRFIYGKTQRSTKINLTNYKNDSANILKLIKDNIEPPFFLKRHCNYCGFFHYCNEKALNEDSLSLLSGIKHKEILKWKNKGIFTINQLSYNFKPRRISKSRNSSFSKHRYELRALSIRESKVHVYKTPSLPKAETEIFFDFEGLPDENYIYLIGLKIKTSTGEFTYSYWANSVEEEKKIFSQFIERVFKYKNFILYHYGSYEIKNLRRIKKKFNFNEQKNIDIIIESSCNLLSLFYSNIYLPIYSNGLKEVGKYLGFEWTDKNASGLQSIVWRKRWEETDSNEYKSTIIIYNREDCAVLKKVKKFILSIIKNEQQSIVKTEDLIRESIFQRKSALTEIDTIKKFSYFDYQKYKVSARKEKPLFKTSSNKIKKIKTKLPTNKCKNYRSLKCPSCKSRNIYKKHPIFKKTVDLKFSKTGVKKWIVKHCTNTYNCQNCKKIYNPLSYAQIDSLYGYRLKCWIIFQHYVNRESFRQIEFNLWEIFGIKTHKGNIIRYKKFFSNYYKKSIERIKYKLTNGEVLYVDETPFNLKSEKGYVWVFSNLNQVFFSYKPNRDGSFLKDFLKNFKGVLVTDFYSAYNSLNCSQQKCLIHIIRDFNDDLLKNPFDSEFKSLTKLFTNLLQKIIKTVDSHGLNRLYLIEHKKEVEEFFSTVLEEKYCSDIAKKYQKRLKKYKLNLFNFINYDNVSWNNNIAEHAIKILSSHSHKTINSYTSTKINEYLNVMSLFVTCEYNDISFLKFLLSQKKDIFRYCGN
jgi:predicted RecB family nuclease